jgi:hypothetical protein
MRFFSSLPITEWLRKMREKNMSAGFIHSTLESSEQIFDLFIGNEMFKNYNFVLDDQKFFFYHVAGQYLSHRIEPMAVYANLTNFSRAIAPLKTSML